MKIVIIVQARMTSTRLPGKVLKTVLGKTMLEYQIERLKCVSYAEDLIIATTTNKTDDPIVELCQRLGVQYFRGSEHDVLSRYYQAAQLFEADIIVRVTSDCPLIDPALIDKVIEYYVDNYPAYDYVANCLKRTYPRGMDTEIFSFKALEKVFNNATQVADREHVTLFMYLHPQLFKCANVAHTKDVSSHRWTVDTVEDFALIKNIIESIYPQNPRFTMTDVLDQFSYHPEWMKINAHVEQKHV